MALSIKNPVAERRARQLAAATGETLTQAILHALEDRMERIGARRSAPDVLEALLTISERCSALPNLDTRPTDAPMSATPERSPI